MDDAHAPTSGATASDAPLAGALPAVVGGYRLGAVLGRGGMGEVLLAEDLRFGRDVAVKRMRNAPTTDAITRFLREAKIQARLDHPAIVPVHDLGYDAEGRPYFTMKRLAGTTLAEVLAARSATVQKLLRAFIGVSFAVHFAHERGVIHRDLKPANITLGNYDEVYVLDWGIARVIADGPTATRSSGSTVESSGLSSVEASGPSGVETDSNTQLGAVLGTPGYMSPEQLRGDEVTTATDVYALGAMLFEILAGEPLHARDALGTALTGPAASPARRQQQRALPAAVPPELDALCVAALAETPTDRPTARALADRVQLYLDGDRDTALRRELAAVHLASARADLATADPTRRGHAMRAAGQALALDPESGAAALVSKIMLETIPDREQPAGLVARHLAADQDTAVRQSRFAAITQLGYLAFVPLLMWIGVEDWGAIGGILATVAIVVAVAMFGSYRPAYSMQCVLISLAGNVVIVILLSRLFGPFVIVPAVACSTAVSFLVFPPLIDRWWLVVAPLAVALVAPLVLEELGVFARTFEIVGGTLITRPVAIGFAGTPALVVLISANFGVLISTTLLVRAVAKAQREAQRVTEAQAWHLSQLLPPDTVAEPRPVTPAQCC